MPGTSFDRVAGIYDDTRGGERRGDRFADELAPWIVGPRVVELGVGTGVIAKGLRAHGHDVVGVDLSGAMIRVAQSRIGSRAAIADVDLLPFADGSIDSAYFVWVLHLVHDPATTLAETARVVRAGGRVATITSSSEYDDGDEIAPIVGRLAALRQPRLDHNALVVSDHPGLQLVHEGFTAWDEHETVPSAEADAIEQRIYSSLFDVERATWERVVVPVIDELRALPDPERPRRRRNRHPIVVWTVAAGL